MIDINDPAVQAHLEAYYYKSHGPLSENFACIGWNSGVTTSIRVTDQDAFRCFLDDHEVSYQELDNCFPLYCGNFERWPDTDDDSILFKDQFVIRAQETDEVDRDPFAFWRRVIPYMAPGTFFRVIEIGYVGYAPIVFGRETNYLAMAITVVANGNIVVQDFEDYLVQPGS